MTARHNENAPCAHPGLETELQVLSSPDVQAGVVAAQLEEKVARDCKQTSGHCGWRNRDYRRRRPEKKAFSQEFGRFTSTEVGLDARWKWEPKWSLPPRRFPTLQVCAGRYYPLRYLNLRYKLLAKPLSLISVQHYFVGLVLEGRNPNQPCTQRCRPGWCRWLGRRSLRSWWRQCQAAAPTNLRSPYHVWNSKNLP